MHTLPLLIISSNRQSQPAIDSSSKGTELKWVRDRSGRLVRPDNTPIQEKLNSGFETVESMADRQNVENSRIDPNEPRYTQAEVEMMFNEMMTAKLAELGLTPQNRAQALTTASSQNKKKEPEIFGTLLRKKDPNYHKNLLEKTQDSKVLVEIPDDLVKGKSVMERRLETMKEVISKLQAQLSARNECEYDLEKSVGDTLGRGLIEKFHKLAKFDGSGDPAEHLEQYALSIRLNRLPASFMLDWFSTSLQGPALMWYRNLEKRKKASWT